MSTSHTTHPSILIDGLQYSAWSGEIFRQMHAGGITAAHVTLAYHENTRCTLRRFAEWNQRFEQWPHLIRPVYEPADILRTQALREMNRVGMVIDMSHSAERSTLEAIDYSERPVIVSHANPSIIHPALRNKSDKVIDAIAANEGLLGFSLYPCRRHSHGVARPELTATGSDEANAFTANQILVLGCQSL